MADATKKPKKFWEWIKSFFSAADTAADIGVLAVMIRGGAELVSRFLFDSNGKVKAENLSTVSPKGAVRVSSEYAAHWHQILAKLDSHPQPIINGWLHHKGEEQQADFKIQMTNHLRGMTAEMAAEQLTLLADMTDAQRDGYVNAHNLMRPNETDYPLNKVKGAGRAALRAAQETRQSVNEAASGILESSQRIREDAFARLGQELRNERPKRQPLRLKTRMREWWTETWS